MPWLNWSLKLHIRLRTISLLISTHNTSLCSMNVIFIYVIVLVKMCFHMLNLCWFKHKKIFECFRCVLESILFLRKLKNFKNSVALLWWLSRGSFKSHASAMSLHIRFGNLFVSEWSSHEGYTEIFVTQLATPSQ